mmetsp:Transcript_9259/g.31753  ORF Transcript_9259/g.31753 Transcript_9259/m.31753 type:complete len:210 (+) Transcript_9259:1260-1889(+)
MPAHGVRRPAGVGRDQVLRRRRRAPGDVAGRPRAANLGRGRGRRDDPPTRGCPEELRVSRVRQVRGRARRGRPPDAREPVDRAQGAVHRGVEADVLERLPARRDARVPRALELPHLQRGVFRARATREHVRDRVGHQRRRRARAAANRMHHDRELPEAPLPRAFGQSCDESARRGHVREHEEPARRRQRSIQRADELELVAHDGDLCIV